MTAKAEDYREKAAREGAAIYVAGSGQTGQTALKTVSLTLGEDELHRMHRDAVDANMTLALVHIALGFLGKEGPYEYGGIEAVLELMSRATNDEAAQGAERLAQDLSGFLKEAKGGAK